MKKVVNWKHLLVFSLDAAIIFAIIFYKDIISVLKLMPDCPLYAIGLRCATCGGTRCISALMSFDVLNAVKLNFMVVLFGLYAAVTLPLSNICLFSKNISLHKIFTVLCSGKAAIIWASSFAGYTVLRNISLVLWGFEF